MMENENPGRFRTLFLDRDGTINVRKVGGYIRKVEEFEFLPGVLEALYEAESLFDQILIVTNQQGIGKKLMTEKELYAIHDYMLSQIKNAGGRIDQIYVCPHLEPFDPLCRKPNPGMAIQAKEDFPSISFDCSVMVGDADSDIVFGNRLDMFTVRINTPQQRKEEPADIEVNGLLDFVKHWKTLI